jgi:hypothetical protein
MPAVICYALTGDNREVQLRVRLNSQRVAMPAAEWPDPPKRLLLVCPGSVAELRYVSTTLNYAVYYISAADFDALLDLIRRLCTVEPCRLPCALTAPQTAPPPT